MTVRDLLHYLRESDPDAEVTVLHPAAKAAAALTGLERYPRVLKIVVLIGGKAA